MKIHERVWISMKSCVALKDMMVHVKASLHNGWELKQKKVWLQKWSWKQREDRDRSSGHGIQGNVIEHLY